MGSAWRLVGACALAAVTAVATGGLHHVADASNATVPGGYVIVSASYAVGAGGFSTGSVSCPPTGTGVIRYAQSGGVFDPAGGLNDNIQDSEPTNGGTSWSAEVENPGSAGVTYTVYAVCAKPHRAYTVVTSSNVDNPGSTRAEFNEPCPAGTKITGGGVRSVFAGAGGVSLNDEYPSGNGWHVDYNNQTDGDNTINVVALCSKWGSTTGYTVVQGSAVSNGAGAQTAVGVPCPTGLSVLGGGVGTQDTLDTVASVNSTYPNTGGAGWGNYENNSSGFAYNVYGYAVCAK